MNDLTSVDAAEPLFCGFRNAADIYRVLAGEIAEHLTQAALRDGRASVVVAGGTTPGDLYDNLKTRDVPWKDVTITLSDERWIDPGSERSNENLARRRLLTGGASAAVLVPFKTVHAHAHEAEAAVHDAVAAMKRPFDVVVLGMGVDGHTASLIPGAEGLQRALDRGDPALVRAVNPPDLTAMGERMTLTLRGILDARWIVLLIRGEAKLAAYKRALAGRDVMAAPVRAVLHQGDVPVSVFWAA